MTTTKWGAEHFTLKDLNFSVTDRSLESAVKMLKATTKQAFYAAIVKNGVLRRKTWNGCAFNAGGLVLETPRQVTSFAVAADAFGDTPAVVRRFIAAWDNSSHTSDEAATKYLKMLLEKTGIFNDPDTPKIQRRIVVQTIEQSTMTDQELLDEFEQIVLSADLDSELAKILDQAEMLVSA